MSLHSLFNRFFRFPIPHRAAVMTVILITLASSTPVFCGEIHDAAKAGDLAKVKALLKSNSDLVFTKDNDSLTPLHAAARAGHTDVAELLLVQEAAVNAKTSDRTTHLKMATLSGHMDMVELLSQCINKPFRASRTPAPPETA